MKYALLLFCSLTILLISCKKEEHASKSDFGVPSEEPNQILTADNYSENSLKYLNYQRKDMQTVLPNAINDVIGVYKTLLIDVEKNKIYSTSAKEHKKYMLEAQAKAFDSLVSKDIAVNEEYSELLQNLENLNIQYSKKYNIPIDSFKSYYTLDKIILSEEVLLKVQELIKDDQKRTEKLNKEARNDMIADRAVTVISILPMGGFLANVTKFSKIAITQIHNAASSAAKNKALSTGSGKIAETAYNYFKTVGNTKLGNKARMVLVKELSNEAKRTRLNTSVVSSLKRATATKLVIAVRNSTDPLEATTNDNKNSAEFFKVIENKIEGRIGDYSDGILSVHLQNVREAIKFNQNLISKRTKTLQ